MATRGVVSGGDGVDGDFVAEVAQLEGGVEARVDAGGGEGGGGVGGQGAAAVAPACVESMVVFVPY